MEEKKKFEKLVWEDIDKVERQYRSNRSASRKDYDEMLCKSPKAKELLAKWTKVNEAHIKAEKELSDMNSELSKAGFRANYGGYRNEESKPYLSVESYGSSPDARKYDNETDKVCEKFDEIKRSYTLKIYASGIEEIVSLFETLQKELQALLK